MLGTEGFEVRKDPEVDKIIRNDYWIGKRGDLEFHAEKYPNGFKIEFFQNVVHENRNGGRYDFDKFQKMPYMIRLQYKKYINQLIRLLKCLVDVEDTTSRSSADMRKNGTTNRKTRILTFGAWTARHSRHITGWTGIKNSFTTAI